MTLTQNILFQIKREIEQLRGSKTGRVKSIKKIHSLMVTDAAKDNQKCKNDRKTQGKRK